MREGVSTTEMVAVGRQRLRTRIRGSGPPLLLLSGMWGKLELWEPLEEHLVGFETIAFDLPGTGGSSFPRILPTMSSLARLTGALLDTLGYRRVHVLGLSFGGMLAQELVRHAPDRVQRLVLAATIHGLGAIPPKPRALGALLNPCPRRTARRVAALYGGQSHLLRRLPRGQLSSLPGYLWQTAALASWTSLPWLRCLRPPTLVLAADDDPLVPLANARILASRIPRSQLHVVRGSGHLFLFERPRELAALIGAFLHAPQAAIREEPQPGRPSARGRIRIGV